MKTPKRTYEKRLGWLNIDKLPSKNTGVVEKFMTRDGVPVCIPDNEEDLYFHTEPIPEGISFRKLYGEDEE